MPIVPEKMSARQGSRSSLSSQFWESTEHSTRYIDGRVWKLACEPPALYMNGSSGVSRSQQLVALQALGIPAIPSYDQHSGGVVFDRVLAKLGGRKWWSTVSGRLKAQRIYTEGTHSSQTKLDALKNLANYALCSRTKVQLTPWMTLNNVVEVMNVKDMMTQSGAWNYTALSTHTSVRASVKGHDICGNYSTNMDHVECTGDYAKVPCAASLDISSQDRQDGLQYRVGMYQVTAPNIESPNSGPSDLSQSMRTVLHAQGAVAVEGEAYIWKGRGHKKHGKKSDGSHKREGKIFDNKYDDKEWNAAEDEGKSVTVVEEAAGLGGNAGEDIEVEKESMEETEKGLEKKHGQNTATEVKLDDFVTSLGSGSEGNINVEESVQASSSQQPLDTKLIQISPESIKDMIEDSIEKLHRVRAQLSKITEDVQEGSLLKLADAYSNRNSKRTRPYSFLLSRPHVKLTASLGCLARMPLPNSLAFMANKKERESIDATTLSLLARAHNASTTSLTSKGSFSSQLAEAWEPYLKGTALRVFSSVGISAQLGDFIKPFMDYTSASMRFDFGLSSQHIVGSLPTTDATSALDIASRPDKHRAFALEGRGSWHSLSVSLAQQVFGPIRARADFRFALDPTNVPQNQGERSTLKGIAQTALSIRPSKLESMFGMDVILPGTEGAARVALWWSPKRKEGMAELRLF